MSEVVVECVESSDNYGKFIAEPLPQGSGVTIGNSLRRVMLGFLPGTAITSVRIDGVQHEFSIIPFAREDVIEFLLNVKAIRLKSLSGRPGMLTIEHQGEGSIKAGDIWPSADFEIVNPEQHLITINDANARLYVEFDVEQGVGFQPADTVENMPLGSIPADAIFSPIRKVNYKIEPVHMGRETSRERLVMDIWTDGTVGPADAISQGAEIFTDQLKPFVDYMRLSQMKDEERSIRTAIPDEKYNMPVEQLELSVRTMNCLRRSRIATVGELVAKGPKELLKLRNLGQKSFKEISERLEDMGINFSSDNEADETDAEVAEENEE
ncbi:DNA-directed RNA polymerase subunit alpha [Chloroflexota bacterium]